MRHVATAGRSSLARVAWVGALAGLSSVVIERFNRPTVGATLEWLAQAPLAATCNALLAVLLGWCLLALTGRAVVSLLASVGLLALVGAAHAMKVSILGKPLFPWDVVLQYREALALLPRLTGSAWGWLGLGAAGLATLAVAARRASPTLGWGARVALGAVVVSSCWALFPRVDRAVVPIGIRNIFWQQVDNYRANGLLLGLALNANSALVQAPVGYDSRSVSAALGARRPAVARLTGERPTVLLVMSESLFDPLRLPRVRFLDDPLPTLHRLQREQLSGTLFPPVFGGGTANTEFEVLTGHSMRFLPAGSVPYQQYLHRAHPSLAKLYAAQGYETVAVHTFHRWFWERERVYQHLGFHRFVGLEDMPAAVLDGPWPSDAMLTAQIIAQFEARRGPLFLFGVSMEAHGPYEAGRYQQQTVRFESELDDEARQQLEAYLEAANHADRELGALVSYFSKVNSPVFIVFFGDHLPSLPRVFEQTGVISSLERPDLRQLEFLHQVPLLIWTNTRTAPRPLGGLSASFLGPVLLELTGTPGSRYTDFLGDVRRALPVMVPGLVSDAEGVFSDEPPASLRALEEAWWTLEYDQLFGDELVQREEG